jgi:myosin V
MYDLEGMTMDDFHLLNQTGTYDRRDGVMDEEMHSDMLDAMVRFVGFIVSFVLHLLEASVTHIICALLIVS